MAPHTAVAAPSSTACIAVPLLTKKNIHLHSQAGFDINGATQLNIATNLYRELIAAQAVISAMQNVLRPAEKWAVAEELGQAGLIGKSGGTFRTAERHAVLRAAENAGIK